MPKNKDRIIIDTNLWISFLLAKNFSILDKFFSKDGVVLLFSKELLDEFIEVAERSKFERYFSKTDLKNLLIQIRFRSEFVNTTSNINVCRDPKDDFLLSLSKDGNADFLITGDKDLLALKRFGKTRIITLTTFCVGK